MSCQSAPPRWTSSVTKTFIGSTSDPNAHPRCWWLAHLTVLDVAHLWNSVQTASMSC